MTVKIYSTTDAKQDDDGRWYISFECPVNGGQPLTTFSAERTAQAVNDYLATIDRSLKAKEPYRKSVDALSRLCLTHDGSGAHAAAQVLLGTYNSVFHVDLVDLCNLDAENFEHAMAVIRGRVKCWAEPHNMIENGDDVFLQLWEKWGHLHSSRRYARFYENQKV